MHEHAQLLRDPKVSKCDQSRWPSSCAGFHCHHVLGKEYMGQYALYTVVMVNGGAYAYYIMVSKIQWTPFWLPT